MALSGTGTVADPYILNNYADLMELVNGRGTYWALFDDVYAQLANNIDASNITPWNMLPTGSYVLQFNLHFDLNGHSITNIHAGNEEAEDSAYPFNATELYNGVITFYTTAPRRYPMIGGIENIHDMTITGEFEFAAVPQGTSFESYALGGGLSNCNITLTIQYPNISGKNSSYYYAIRVPHLMEYCDINVIASRNHIYRSYSDSSGMMHYDGCTGILSVGALADTRILKKCRIRGVLTDSDVTLSKFLTDGRMTTTNYSLDIDTCVYNFDFRGCSIPVEMVDSSYDIITGTTITDTVINKTLITSADLHGGIKIGSVIPCSTREIINGSALRNKGFPVTNMNNQQ